MKETTFDLFTVNKEIDQTNYEDYSESDTHDNCRCGVWIVAEVVVGTYKLPKLGGNGTSVRVGKIYTRDEGIHDQTCVKLQMTIQSIRSFLDRPYIFQHLALMLRQEAMY